VRGIDVLGIGGQAVGRQPAGELGAGALVDLDGPLAEPGPLAQVVGERFEQLRQGCPGARLRHLVSRKQVVFKRRTYCVHRDEETAGREAVYKGL
jgi:hypothetical protein